jgi:hypothetical protein
VTGPRIQHPSGAEFHARMAVLHERAAAAYASELSTARDPRRREFLGQKVADSKRQARECQELAEKLAASE